MGIYCMYTSRTYFLCILYICKFYHIYTMQSSCKTAHHPFQLCRVFFLFTYMFWGGGFSPMKLVFRVSCINIYLYLLIFKIQILFDYRKAAVGFIVVVFLNVCEYSEGKDTKLLEEFEKDYTTITKSLQSCRIRQKYMQQPRSVCLFV